MPVNTCIDRATLRRFVEGELTAAEMDEAQAHMERCDKCSQSLRQLPENSLAAVIRAAKDWPAELVESEFVRNVVQQVLNRCADVATVGSEADTATISSKFGVEQQTVESWDFLSPPQEAGELGRLGSYRILRVFRAGGMGIVFLAEDVQLKRRVALKVMKPVLATDPLARQRFLGEAEKTAAIKHDHIVTIHQVGEDRGVAFLVMELLEGEALADRLSREGRLPVTDVLGIGREVAEGLAAAHERGLIHRDIKPENIWLERGNGSTSCQLVPPCRVKILDFGLAQAVGDDVRLTKHGFIIGTPAFMAPEQAKGGVVDQRSDLFSLGCVLYLACTGVLPFKGDDTMSTLVSRMMDRPRPPREINADVPVALSKLIMQMLAKDPARRPASARVVVQAIGDIERGARAAERGARSVKRPLHSTLRARSAPRAGRCLCGCATRWRAAGTATAHHSDQRRRQGHRDQASTGCKD